MRIGFIGYDFYPPIGGQGVETYGLYKTLQNEKDVDIFVFSSRENNLDNHIHIPTIMNINGLGPFYFSFWFNRNLHRIIKKYKLDLLQIYGGPGGVFLLRKPNVPVIYVANHTYAQQYKNLEKSIYRVLMKLERKGYKYAQRIVAISTTTKDSLVNDYQVPSEKITVIPVGVDVGIFKPLDIKKIPNSVLYVGRLCERKGLYYLIESIKMVREAIPNIKLYLIGKGNLREELQRLVEKHGLLRNVVFIGKVSEEELIKWYNRAEVFVLPSLFEGFGIVCIEAMACGVPVIGTKVPGIVDIIRDRDNGLLVPPQDPDSLAKAIVQMLKDKGLCKYLGERERKGILGKFDWSKISEEFIDLYKGFKNVKRA